MATKVFQRGNFVIVDKNGKETIIPIDNFEYDFTTPTTVKLKDVQEKNEISEALADLQNEAGTPIGTVSDVNDYFETFVKLSSSAPPVGGATEAKQDTQIDQTVSKYFGLTFDVTQDIDAYWSGYPFNTLSLSISNAIDTDITVDLVGSFKSSTELVNGLNQVQSKVIFSVNPATPDIIVFSSREYNIDNVTSVVIVNDNGDELLYDTFVGSADSPTGAVHQLVELSKLNTTNTKQISEFLVSANPVVSILNSSTSVLANGVTFTGGAELNTYPTVMIIPYADQNGILYVEFSNDGINWTTSLSFPYDTTKINPPHIFTKGVRYYRTRFENNSGNNQTAFNLITCYGDFKDLTTSINSLLSQTFDATATRPTDYYSEIAQGKRQGIRDFSKFGNNLNLNGTSRVIASFGTSGFVPLAVASTLEITFSSANDTFAGDGAKTITITGVTTGYVEQTETINTNGGVFTTTSVWLGINRVVVSSAGTILTNDGDITITATSDGSIQAQIPAQTSTTRQLIFFVPINTNLNIFSYIFNTTKTSGGTPRIDILGYVFKDGVKTLVFDAQIDTANSSIVTEDFKVPFFIEGGSCYWAEALTSSGSGAITARMQQIVIDK